jgi:hypothetical protein
MSNDEIEFEARKQKIEAFKADLAAVFQRHEFGIKESDNYDGSDEYLSTSRYFVVDGETWFIQDVDQIINEVIDANI